MSNKYFTDPKIGGLLITLVILSALFLIMRAGDSPQCEINLTDSRPILYSDLDVTELWSVSMKIPNLTSYSPIAITSELLMVAHSCNEITGFKLNSGEEYWRSERITTPTDVTLDIFHNQIYVTAQEQLRSISIASGNTNWINESPILTKNPPPSRMLSNYQIVAYARHEGVRYVNPENGILSDPVALPPSSFWLDDEIILVDKGAGVIQALNVTDNDVVWTSRKLYEGSLSTESYRPDIQEDLLILRSLGFLDQPIVINKNTGKKQWDDLGQSIASNVYVNNLTAYVLTSDAALLQLNSQDGTLSGIVRFTPPQVTELLYSDAGIGGSWVAAIDDIVVIYFQDIDTLSAYRIKPKSPDG